MNRYKHIVFNPKLGDSPLTQICEKFDGSVWGLSYVIPVTEYEWVAVFEAFDGFAGEEQEFGRKSLTLTPLGEQNLHCDCSAFDPCEKHKKQGSKA